MPVFSSFNELSELCHISTDRLIAISHNSYSFYRRTSMLKKDGKLRIIHQPTKEVKAIQAWILRSLLDKIHPSHHATAFRKGLSIRENIEPHASNRFFLCLDIKDFFPTITRKEVSFLFQNIGYLQDQADILSRLCTCGNILPQGGVTSPSLSNLVVNRMDRRLSGYCSKKNIIYTRYADDMTFSSNNRNILNSAKKFIMKIVEDEGFVINEKKTHFTGPKMNTTITGVVKNSSEPCFGIGKRKKTHMRSVLFNLIINHRSIDEKYNSEKSFNGWLSYVKSIDERSYDYFIRYKERLKRTL